MVWKDRTKQALFTVNVFSANVEIMNITSLLVTEITEVSGAAYGDHLPDSGVRPAGHDVPHAWTTCEKKTSQRRHQSWSEHEVTSIKHWFITFITFMTTQFYRLMNRFLHKTRCTNKRFWLYVKRCIVWSSVYLHALIFQSFYFNFIYCALMYFSRSIICLPFQQVSDSLFITFWFIFYFYSFF